jgi:hypothetical protein
MRITFTTLAVPPPPCGAQDWASSTIESTARSLIGAQWLFKVSPIKRNIPDGSNTWCFNSCSISSGSKMEQRYDAWAAWARICDWMLLGLMQTPDMLVSGWMTEIRTCKNSERSALIREGVRRVRTFKEVENAGIGACEGIGTCLQAQTTGCGLPWKSNETHVHPEINSRETADQ